MRTDRTPVDLFSTPFHEPFRWENGSRAALLVHGFPGSPGEMRPLGAILRDAGWTVQGLLLPGFGAELDALPGRSHADWTAAVRDALRDLRQRFAPVMLIGNSMGAALSLQAAAHVQPDGVVLFAPFWRVAPWLDRAYPLARRIFPKVRPFLGASFDNPRFRDSLQSMFPDADLDDPAVRRAVRALTVPTHVLGQVRRAGQLGYHFAAQVQSPALIVQGHDDPLVQPEFTRQLAARLPNLAGYLEVPGQHEIVRGQTPHWSQVAAAVCTFGAQL